MSTTAHHEPTPYAAGQRVMHGYSGPVGTVTGVTGTRVAVAFDDGGTDSQPLSHRAYRILPDADSLYRDGRPAAQPDDAYWTDTVVTQGHADYCAAWGHAEGEYRCPRCGDVLPVRAEDSPAARDMANPGPDHYSIFVGSSPVFDAATESGAIMPRPLQGIVRDRARGFWEGETENVGIYRLRADDDATAQRIAYAATVATGNDCVMILRQLREGEDSRAMDSVARFRVTAEWTHGGNRTAPVLRGESADGGFRYSPDVKGGLVAWLVWSDATVTAVL